MVSREPCFALRAETCGPIDGPFVSATLRRINRDSSRTRRRGAHFRPILTGNRTLMETRTRNQQQIANLSDIFVQGMARMVDLQTAATRVLLQSQWRSAAIFGAPDWSRAVNWPTEHYAQLFTAG